MTAFALYAFARSGLGFGTGVRWSRFPVAACDWIESHDVRGRCFNKFPSGGYLLWRFWPDRGRLPFMDVHQTGTREDRALYVSAQIDSAAWRRLDRKYRFDWVLLPRVPHLVTPLIDFVDGDTTTWALVFVDDAAAVWLRREGPMGALAGRERYRLLRAWTAGIVQSGRRAVADPALRPVLRAELERAAGSSRWNATAFGLLANLEMLDHRYEAALAALDRAARVPGGIEGLDARRARALQALGRVAEARAAWLRVLDRSPGDPEARDSLATLARGSQ